MIISSFVRIVIDTIILVFSSKTGKRFVSDQETVLESCMKKILSIVKKMEYNVVPTIMIIVMR